MDFTPNPIAFSVLGFGIRWYAVLICAGILLASAIGLFRIKRRGISRNDYLDVILYSVPLGIIGARAWYVIFEWQQYHSLFDVLNIRAGGLGIHGGMIVSMLTAFIVCRVKHISFLDCMDTAVPCAALAQAIGRWGNFFNQEAYGTVTNLPWAIVIDGNHVHPTFLYESIWCLFLFIFLSIKDRKKKFRGQTLTLYMILYSLERFFVEQLRVDSLLYGPSKLVLALKKAGLDPSQVPGVEHFGPFLLYPFRTAQCFSLCAIALGLLLYLILMLVKVKPPKKFVPAYDYVPVGEYYDDDEYLPEDYDVDYEDDYEDPAGVYDDRDYDGYDDTKPDPYHDSEYDRYDAGEPELYQEPETLSVEETVQSEPESPESGMAAVEDDRTEPTADGGSVMEEPETAAAAPEDRTAASERVPEEPEAAASSKGHEYYAELVFPSHSKEGDAPAHDSSNDGPSFAAIDFSGRNEKREE